jgi:hypothetical protein
MNRHTKLKNAINDIVELHLENDEIFFSQKVPQLLFRVLKLMEFQEIANPDFLRYLSFFQNDVKLDINRSLQLDVSSSFEEKEALLNLIKNHTRAKLKVVEFSFAYYLKDKSKLFKEEDHSVSKHNSILVKRLHLYDWFFNHGKSGDNMANSAAAS